MRRGADGVEDAAEEGEGEDHDVVDEARVVEGLGVDADDRAEGSEADEGCVAFKDLSGRLVPRPFGLCAGMFAVPDDFDAPLPDDILQGFEGR